MSAEGQIPDVHRGAFGPAHDALNRMKRAHDRGTGCHLTAEMVEALYLTFLGEVWSADDPRLSSHSQKQDDQYSTFERCFK